MPHMHLLTMLATLKWDPQIRGMLIVVTAVAILPGSVYLLLATNVGARIGFLLAVAGLTGWMTLLAITWTFYGQGLKGRDPSWKVKEVVHTQAPNDLSSAALKTLQNFPAGWRQPTPSVLGDAQAAADNFITKTGRLPKNTPEGPLIKKPTPEQLRYPAEFPTSDSYVVLGGYEKGGNNCWGPKELCTHHAPKKILFWTVNHKFFFRHAAHYVTVELQAAQQGPNDPAGNITYTKNPDPTQPIVAVVVERDLGSIRFPQIVLGLSSFIIFAVTCHALHRRDKQIMALRAAGTPAVA